MAFETPILEDAEWQLLQYLDSKCDSPSVEGAVNGPTICSDLQLKEEQLKQLGDSLLYNRVAEGNRGFQGAFTRMWVTLLGRQVARRRRATALEGQDELPTLVAGLQHDCADQSNPVASLLQKALLVALRCDDTHFAEWIHRECNGYKAAVADADYRNLKGQYVVLTTSGRTLPILWKDSTGLKSRFLTGSISELESLLAGDGDTFAVKVNVDAGSLTSITLEPGDGIAFSLSRATIAGFLFAVRQRVLQWTIEQSGRFQSTTTYGGEKVPRVVSHMFDSKPMTWDLFISHASEDKDEVARPLADLFIKEGLKVWYDDYTLLVGDSLRRSIDRGLAGSRFGLVILSPNFFDKEWPQKELVGLVAREDGSEKRILPVWHKVKRSDVVAFSPPLADKLGVSTAKGLDHVVREIMRVFRRGNDEDSNKEQVEDPNDLIPGKTHTVDPSKQTPIKALTPAEWLEQQFPTPKTPTEWLLEAARRIPALKYAIGVVGLIAAAAISIGFFLGHWEYALFGGIAVICGMFLVRLYVAYQPANVKINPSIPIQVVLWAIVLAFVAWIAMGTIWMGLKLFAKNEPDISNPKKKEDDPYVQAKILLSHDPRGYGMQGFKTITHRKDLQDQTERLRRLNLDPEIQQKLEELKGLIPAAPNKEGEDGYMIETGRIRELRKQITIDIDLKLSHLSNNGIQPNNEEFKQADIEQPFNPEAEYQKRIALAEKRTRSEPLLEQVLLNIAKFVDREEFVFDFSILTGKEKSDLIDYPLKMSALTCFFHYTLYNFEPKDGVNRRDACKKQLESFGVGELPVGWACWGRKKDVPHLVLFVVHVDDLYVWVIPDRNEDLKTCTKAIQRIITDQ